MKALITIDVEGIPSQNSFSSVDRLAKIIDSLDIPCTLFVTPRVVNHRPSRIETWHSEGHAIGLHIHPGRMEGGDSDWLSEYDTDEISRFISNGVAVFESELGISPTLFRAGRWEYSESLMRALANTGFRRDASLKTDDYTTPFERFGVQEFPISVYTNPIVRVAMQPWTYQFIPMHLDAFLANRLASPMFYFVTRRLLRSDRPYLMVSYHDYDINSSRLYSRILEYLRYLDARASIETLDELAVREGG